MSKIIIYQIFTRLFGNRKINPVINGTRKQNGVGKFNDITDKALLEIKNLGITHIWFTGIIKHSIVDAYPENNIANGNPLIIKGKAGSPYAITDYYDVDPDLACNIENRMYEFEKLVERTHNNNMKVIIDFVPNHVARDYSSVKKPNDVKNLGETDNNNVKFNINNNFYYLPKQKLKLPDELINKFKDYNYTEFPCKATGNDKFSADIDINDWYDTIKLNYGIDFRNDKKYFDPIPDTWNKMLDILLFWASKNIDAFRCDMAEMVPVEFWHSVIPKVKKMYPKIIFIAEIYKPSLYSNYINYGNFDYLYDKVGLYDTLKKISTLKESASQLTSCWQNLNGIDKYMLRFIENHDEQRVASKYFLSDMKKAIPLMLVAATMNTGPVMIYFGQEFGEPARGVSGFSGDDGRTTIFDYWNVPEFQKWFNKGKVDGNLLSIEQKEIRNIYKKIFKICQNEAVYKGNFYDLMWYNQDNPLFNQNRIYTFLRYTHEQKFLFIINFDSNNKLDINIKVPKDAFDLMQISNNQTINACDIFLSKNKFNITVENFIQTGINLEIKNNNGCVFKLNNL